MATREQVEFVHTNLIKSHPVEFFKLMDDTNAGIRSVLKILHESQSAVTAGAISEAMGVSTARVAVLLKKMAAKGLILKETDKSDARVTIVRLSEYGEQTAARMKETMIAHLSFIIDTVGMEKIEQFIALSREIRAVMQNTPLPPPPKF